MRQLQKYARWLFELPADSTAKGELILKRLFAILEFFQKTNKTIQS